MGANPWLTRMRNRDFLTERYSHQCIGQIDATKHSVHRLHKTRIGIDKQRYPRISIEYVIE